MTLRGFVAALLLFKGALASVPTIEIKVGAAASPHEMLHTNFTLFQGSKFFYSNNGTEL